MPKVATLAPLWYWLAYDQQGHYSLALARRMCYNRIAMDARDLDREELLQSIVNRIAEAIHPQRIILFGSWARDERGPHSDVDLLIIQESDLPRPQRYAQVRRLFWGMKLPMDILVYTPEELARYQSVPGSFTHTVAREGKVLYERASA